jgi:hypothetical protein
VIWDKSTIPGNSSTPGAPLMLKDLSVTSEVEGAASDTVPSSSDVSDNSDIFELPLITSDDSDTPVAPGAPQHVPAVPRPSARPLTPPAHPSEPKTPSPDVKGELNASSVL